MALQRIVLTSPWKLGLFVCVLVLGCGFGLIYAYLSLFGANVDFQDEAILRVFFAMCGGVALLAVLGYVSVVTQARPLEKVMRGGQKRAKLLRRLGDINDPRDVDLSEFEHEPDLVAVLERWIRDSGAANNAQMAIVSQREALSNLAARVQTATQSPEEIVAAEDELQPLVDAINDLMAGVRNQPAEPAAPQDEALGVTWRESVEDLRQQHSQLLGFAASVAALSEELARRTQMNLASDDAGQVGATLRDGKLRGICARSAQRIAQLRTTLETLAEEANRLSINAALQVSRLGESGTDLLAVTEEIRSVSTRYQRLAGDLRLCENDQEMVAAALDDLTARASGSGDDERASAGLSADSIGQVAMVLDQNAGGLKEIATRLARRLQALQRAMGLPVEPLDAPEVQVDRPTAARPAPSGSAGRSGAPARPAASSRPVAPARPAAPPRAVASSGAPSGPSTPGDVDPAILSADSASGPRASTGTSPHSRARIFDLREFGAVELPMLTDDRGQLIFDLRELGAVEL